MRYWRSIVITVAISFTLACGQVAPPTSPSPTSAVAARESLTSPGPLPTLQPAQALCAKDGGVFIDGGFAYGCQFSGPTDYQAQPAGALCERGYGGIFAPEDDNYHCRW